LLFGFFEKNLARSFKIDDGCSFAGTGSTQRCPSRR